jgi:hypothetical protein
MPDPTALLVAASLGVFASTGAFLAVLAVAGWRRSRGRAVGPRLTNLVSLLGGATIGTMLLAGGDVLVDLPLIALVVVVEVALLRQRRRNEAGWLLLGAAAPWAAFQGIVVVDGVRRREALDVPEALGLVLAAIGVAASLVLVIGNRGPAAPGSERRRAPDRTGRRLGDVARAILAPAAVGPFGLPEVGLIVALVGTWVVGGLLLPAQLPEVARLGILVILGAAIGTEAWIRSLPTPARRAFEAFSWLGEWDLARARRQTGRAVPTSPRAAQRWLAARPDRPEERWLRVEVLLLAGRVEEARAVAERMPGGNPEQRLDRALALNLADWFAGGSGDLARIEALAGEVGRADPDAGLRAQVAIAVAQVRRRLAAGDDPITAGDPLREVRQRLGSRADGQVGRAMRPRLWRTLLVVGGGLAALTVLVETLGVGT